MDNMKITILKCIYFLLVKLFLHSNADELLLISKNKPADISSASVKNDIYANPSENGIDGNKQTYFETGSFKDSWFLINLLNVYQIYYITMFNRHDSNGERLADVSINIGNSWRRFKQCGYFAGPGKTGGIYNVTCIGTGKFVFLQQSGEQHFHLSEVEVYGTELEIPIESELCLSLMVNGAPYYDGTLSVTQSGRKCQRWETNDPHTPNDVVKGLGLDARKSMQNYCSNPTLHTNSWCYTMDPKKKWEDCNTPHCHKVKGDCLDTRFDEQNYYEGTLSTAANGTKCIDFNQIHSKTSQFKDYDVYRGSFDSYKNYCRNPKKATNPGCYTSKSEWKECNLRRCTNSDESSSQLLSYRKPTEMSGEYGPLYSSDKGVDGIHNNFFDTDKKISWWRVDLIDLCEIRFILMFNRFDKHGERLRQIKISTGMSANSVTQCAQFEGRGITHKMYNITCESIGKIVELKQDVKDHFTLSEVEVYGKILKSSLISYRKPTAMSSEVYSFKATYGVDGDPNTFFHTDKWAISWWRVDLIDYYEMKYVIMLNRKDCCGERLRGITVSIGGFTDNVTSCGFFQGPGATGATYNIKCEGVGRIVELKQAVAGYIHLAEVEVYGDKLVDGNWSEWVMSPSCCKSGNVQCHKTRTCTNPKPQHGGEGCMGMSNTIVKCSNKMKKKRIQTEL